MECCGCDDWKTTGWYNYGVSITIRDLIKCTEYIKDINKDSVQIGEIKKN